MTEAARFDLIYVETPEGRTMSCGILDSGGSALTGPFPAKEAGPKIVDALLQHPELGFEDRKQAESTYMMVHFRNMSRGENDAGQSYPFRLTK